MNVAAIGRSRSFPAALPAGQAGARLPASTAASPPSFATQLQSLSSGAGPASVSPEERQLRETFDSVVGQTLFAQMLRSMRKTVRKPAYFHGGRAEEVFQQQLDQVLAEKISQASASQFTGPMYELFTLSRK
jgi:Rod binding domain-containing protein